MAVLDFLTNQQQAAAFPLVKTATASLTVAELQEYPFIQGSHASSAIVLTLPPASAALAGMARIIQNVKAATTKVFVLAGYGGAGASYDTITLARGDMAVVACDGSYWYQASFATASAS